MSLAWATACAVGVAVVGVASGEGEVQEAQERTILTAADADTTNVILHQLWMLSAVLVGYFILLKELLAGILDRVELYFPDGKAKNPYIGNAAYFQQFEDSPPFPASAVQVSHPYKHSGHGGHSHHKGHAAEQPGFHGGSGHHQAQGHDVGHDVGHHEEQAGHEAQPESHESSYTYYTDHNGHTVRMARAVAGGPLSALKRAVNSLDVVDTTFRVLDVGGDGCRRRAVCEVQRAASSYPLLGDLLQYFSSSITGLDQYVDAQGAGAALEDCHLLFDCPHSFL